MSACRRQESRTPSVSLTRSLLEAFLVPEAPERSCRDREDAGELSRQPPGEKSPRHTTSLPFSLCPPGLRFPQIVQHQRGLPRFISTPFTLLSTLFPTPLHIFQSYFSICCLSPSQNAITSRRAVAHCWISSTQNLAHHRYSKKTLIKGILWKGVLES